MCEYRQGTERRSFSHTLPFRKKSAISELYYYSTYKGEKIACCKILAKVESEFPNQKVLPCSKNLSILLPVESIFYSGAFFRNHSAISTIFAFYY